MQQVVVVVPVDADVDEAEHVAEETGTDRPSAATVAPVRNFISSTMIVMMMAITPSLNASMRPLPISASDARNHVTGQPCSSARPWASFFPVSNLVSGQGAKQARRHAFTAPNEHEDAEG